MLTSSLLDPLLAVSRGARIGNMAPFQWRRGASVTTVVASGGYPDAPVTGFPVHLPSFSDSVRVFHAGTKRGDNGDLLTSGGRVFAVTALADSFAAAQRASRDAASRIEFEGAVYRRDIGWREASRVG